MNTIDILKKARENIASPESWTTGNLIDKRMGVTCYCALGAVCAVEFPEELRQYAGEPDTKIDAYGMLETSYAVDALAAAIPADRMSVMPSRNTSRVYGFNDYTTHDDVLALFDRAIANEQAKGFDSRARTSVSVSTGGTVYPAPALRTCVVIQPNGEET